MNDQDQNKKENEAISYFAKMMSGNDSTERDQQIALVVDILQVLSLSLFKIIKKIVEKSIHHSTHG